MFIICNSVNMWFLQVEASLILPIPANSKTLFCGLSFLYKEQFCCVFLELI